MDRAFAIRAPAVIILAPAAAYSPRTPRLLHNQRSSSLGRCRLTAAAQSTDAGGEGGAAAAEEKEVEAPPPIDRDLLLSSALATPPVSLINYANIQKALNGEALLTPDHYATLGLLPGTSYEEVETAFRKRCEIILQQGSNEEEIRNKLRALKVSYDILSSEEERRLYDWSLCHSQSPGGFYRWPHESDITQSDCAPGPPQAPDDEEGIRKTVYFFIGWFVLSIFLSIILK